MLLRPLLVALLMLGVSCQSPHEYTAKAGSGARSGESLDPATVAEVGRLIDDLYSVISGPAGQQRNWPRMLSLFHADARMVPMVRAGSGARPMLLTPQDYVERFAPALERDGFFEQEMVREIQVFGDFAHVWSTYQGRRTLQEEPPFLRGINSIQLLRLEGRWQVLSIVWQQEADAGAIPGRYLPGSASMSR